MKNTKLNLNDLKVKSFVTNLESEVGQTVQGGSGTCRYESVLICEEPAPSVGCPVETFYTACGGCRTI